MKGRKEKNVNVISFLPASQYGDKQAEQTKGDIGTGQLGRQCLLLHLC